MMNDDFKLGYGSALAFIDLRINMLRLEYPTNIRKRNSLEKAYRDLLDELIEHLKYNEGLDKNEKVS